MKHIVLFDGECHFCDNSVQFIIKRDPNSRYLFASLQSEIGRELLKKYRISPNIDSLVLIEGDEYYVKSTAALRICRQLTGFWKMMQILLIIPAPLRDYFYEMFAKNRYKWFGRKEQCELPSPEIKQRFLK